MKKIPEKFLNKIYLIKPLIRKEIYQYQKNEKKLLDDQKKILIIGGSQGAKFFDEFITNLIVKLSKIQNIKVLQQVIIQKSKNNKRFIYKKSNRSLNDLTLMRNY